MSSRKFPPKQKPKNKQFNTDKFLLERKQQKIAWNFHWHKEIKEPTAKAILRQALE